MTSNPKRETAARDSVLARLMLGFEGDHVSSELAGYLDRGLAGVALYPRNFRSVQDLRKLTDSIHRAASHPVLIGIDQEGGTRFALPAPFTSWPSAAELGRLGDVELIRRAARAMALELRAAGCNLDFAPMLDLNMNPESPVTRDRSFGNDPITLPEWAWRFIKDCNKAECSPARNIFRGTVTRWWTRISICRFLTARWSNGSPLNLFPSPHWSPPGCRW